MANDKLTGRVSARWTFGLALAASVLLTGCPTAPVGTSGPTEPIAQRPVSVEIISPTTGFPVSVLDSEPLTVIYTATGTPDALRGYYLPVSGPEATSEPLGDPVIVDGDLEPGEGKFFSFIPADAGVGFFRVGVIAIVGTQQIQSQSVGVIEVQGTPDPTFLAPDQDITIVEQGDAVTIRFDARDPQNDVRWRLFYLAPGASRTTSPDQIGTTLGQPGSGNAGQFLWNVDGLAPGDYQLGLAATDSGSTVSRTVADGLTDRIFTIPNDSVSTPIIRIVEQATSTPPTLTFSKPGNDDIELFRDETFTIRFEGKVLVGGATGTIDIFYDDDRNVANGVMVLPGSNDVPVSTTTAEFPTDLAEGTYNVGGTIRDGINQPVTVYAVGQVIVSRTLSVEVLEPSVAETFRPGTPIEITWQATGPAGLGTFDVFAQRLNADGTAKGAPITVALNAPRSRTSATFTTNTSGLYEFRVVLELADGTTVEDTSPVSVRVSSLPGLVWTGSLVNTTGSVAGAVFGGANFEDNAGTSFVSAGDMDGDGTDDLLIAARYAKPFFANPDGIGHGEGYLIFGRSGNRLRGEFNLNAVGTPSLRGVTFAGIRTPQGNLTTDGLSSVARIPDVDGDGRGELVFGFPNVDSRGHNISELQDGVFPPIWMQTLERERQFLRGGVVFVSSRNSSLASPLSNNPVMHLDLVGQDFQVTCVDLDPQGADGLDDGLTADVLYLDNRSDVTIGTGPDDPNTGCEGNCRNPTSGGRPDATNLDFGFVLALARDYFSNYVYNFEFGLAVNLCPSVQPFLSHECLAGFEDIGFIPHDYCDPFASTCGPFSPGLHRFVDDTETRDLYADIFDPFIQNIPSLHSGFYPEDRLDIDGNTVPNLPLEPFGARVIGVGLGDKFGTSLALSDRGDFGTDLVVSAPDRTARGILLGPLLGPEGGGEIDGLEAAPGIPQTNPGSGVAYMFRLQNLWSGQDPLTGEIPPRPHQYIVGEASGCGGVGSTRINIEATRIAGLTGDHLTNIDGIEDFNGDSRADLAFGAPQANGRKGRVYIAYRRAPGVGVGAGLEGDFVLDKLAAKPTDNTRLDGLLIVSDTVAALGSSFASGVDFDGDGASDLVISSPEANGGVGEILILFGGSNLVTPENGLTVETLLSLRRETDNGPLAVRIKGNPRDAKGLFGFNVANGGDIDGDGTNDLLIAAPGATPRFDPDPTDDLDELSEAGVDLDADGVADDVMGPDTLDSAGIVYVVYGSNRLDRTKTCSSSATVCAADADCPAGETCGNATMSISISELGSGQLEGFMVLGRHAGDRLGGGDAGKTGEGGIESKIGRGRSLGLRTAGDVDGDGRADLLIGSILADPRRDSSTGNGVTNAGEVYLLYGSSAPK